MILSSLKELAQTEGLTEDLDYEPKLVAWVISLDVEGKFLGLIPTAMPQPKGKPVAKTMQIPRRVKRTVQDEPDFLVDKPEYVLGLLLDADPKRAKKVEPRRLLFLEQIQKAAAVTANPNLRAVVNFLQSESARAEVIAKPAAATLRLQ